MSGSGPVDALPISLTYCCPDRLLAVLSFVPQPKNPGGHMTYAWTGRRSWTARLGAVGMTVSILVGGAAVTSNAAIAHAAKGPSARIERMYRGMTQIADTQAQERRAARAIAAA